jgi:ABC-type branched-subunit amino acid transport system permease subunit
MKGYGPIALAVALLAAVPLLTSSNVVLNFMVVALLIALVGQGWNVLGGYGGQYSFGHAAFFGTGAYVTAILQVRYGVNAWLGLLVGIAAGSAVGAIIAALSFRSGLRGSYFALVTLAFAEVLRIIASVAPITGAGVGTLVKLDMRWEAFQFQNRAPFYWIILAFVAISLVLVKMIENSRFGAYLVAVRENEDAAKAVGIDVVRVKLAAMTLSAAITAAAAASTRSISCFSMPASPTARGSRSRRCSRRSSAASARVTAAARRAGGADARRGHQDCDRRRAGARSRDLRLRAGPGGGVRAARHRGISAARSSAGGAPHG